MNLTLKDKVILITGGSQGVGAAIARRAAESGSKALVLSGRDASKGEGVARDLPCEARMIVADLSTPDGAEHLFEAAVDTYGRVDALVNAAGLTSRGSVEGASRALWKSLFAVNAESAFILMQQMVRHLKRRNCSGEIVNILSMNVHGGSRDLAIYAASKAALALLTRNAAQHHRFDRIRINGINMGWADTPAERDMQANTLRLGADWLDQAARQQPFGRLLTADDVARLVIFLLSPASEPMTGAIIDQEQWVAGGMAE
ncbi:MAG: oxidoreductase [Hyphomicrobiales bacterium]